MIKRIWVHNYKSLRGVTVKLDPLTVLIGRSGSGKSNLVDGIRFLRQYLTTRSHGFVPQIEWPRIMCRTAQDSILHFTVELTLPGYEPDLTYRLALGPPPSAQLPAPARFGIDYQPFVTEESLVTSGNRVLYQQSDGKWDEQPEVADVPAPGQLALGVVYGIPEAQLAYQFLTKGIGCYDFPSDVLRARTPTPFAPPVPQNSKVVVGLEDDGANYLRVFELIAENVSDPSTLKEILAGLRKLNPSVTTIDLETIRRDDILVGHRIGGQPPVLTLGLGQESEGFRRFLAHLLALYQLPAKQTLVFEEPEKGIYPGALEALASYLKIAAAKRSQIILTTHNPLMLDHFDVEQIRVVDMPGFETRIGRVVPDQIQSIRQELMGTGELLTVDEARTDSSSTEPAGALS